MSKTAKQVKPNFAPAYAALYPQLAKIFVRHGYALAIHGSMARDFDLIAVPWRMKLSEPQDVIKEICSTFTMSFIASATNPIYKAHGRIAYTIIVGFGECCLDLSFMPIQSKMQKGDL
jgi:hypothetical protein